jgi:hypothetical protein
MDVGENEITDKMVYVDARDDSAIASGACQQAEEWSIAHAVAAGRW